MTSLAFSTLPLSNAIQRAITEMGFEFASPIQEQAIPKMLTGVDIIGQAQTGTGKTAAFAIPVLERVDPKNRAVQAIILCPTRELALQVTEQFRKLGKYQSGVLSMAVYGGQPIHLQMKFLRRNPQIIIGTPGRVLDLIRREALRLERVNMAVLDEADEMLNMGFRKDIETILSHMPDTNRQTVLFSATMPKAILDLTAKYQTKAVHIKIAQSDQPVAQVEQRYVEIHRKAKSDALIQLLNHHKFKLSLVFCNTKWQVEALAKRMQSEGYASDYLHGGMPQAKRDKIMQRFRTGNTAVLIATDVAARGIDVNNIEAVFNYDLPKEAEFYIHRIGRTGRAGKSGNAFTFVDKSDYSLLKKLRTCPNVNMTREDFTLLPIPVPA
jgi:ATP-dependent RNA helicase DeaD